MTGAFEEIVVSQGWPTALRGKLDLDGLVTPPPRNLAIGSYHVEVPDPGVAGRPAGEIDGRIKDKSGRSPSTAGSTLAADRSFLLEGLVAPRGNAAAAGGDALDLLGPPTPTVVASSA